VTINLKTQKLQKYLHHNPSQFILYFTTFKPLLIPPNIFIHIHYCTIYHHNIYTHINHSFTHYSNTNLSHYTYTMLRHFTQTKFIQNQIKSFSFIVLIITFALIFINSRSNIIPLNILVFLGSIVLFHYYPNYYDIVRIKAPNLTPLLAASDFIFHYIPLIYILIYKVYNKTEINYPLCITIVILYLMIFHADIRNIYFDYNQYFS
jgi:hypothetical protein